MFFGICTAVEQSATVKAAGWDFVEENVQSFLQGTVPDEKWTGLARAAGQPLPVPAANCMVPGNLKITGPDVQPEKLRNYMDVVLKRASNVDMKTIVFGSAGARNYPEGFDRAKAKQQIIEFAKMSAKLAAERNVTLVAEPLNRNESNIINSVPEAVEYVRAVDHPNFRCLVDSYHFWLENESLDGLREAMPFIRHVHVADKDGRVPPGESGTADYRPFFKVLKDAKYDGLISVEAASFPNIDKTGKRVLEFLKSQWASA